MSATSFDVHTFGRQVPRVPRTPLAAFFQRELDRREAAITEREANIARRERSLEAIERIRDLKDAQAGPVLRQTVVAAAKPFEHAKQIRFHEAFKLSELEWWRKQLGRAPVLR